MLFHYEYYNFGNSSWREAELCTRVSTIQSVQVAQRSPHNLIHIIKAIASQLLFFDYGKCVSISIVYIH
ncbi:MAG: hypothetical protein RMX96_24640 [Nostoc sp. ChiSLP02]|nr:hypothetical protein [Nostoc sp. DedSLP05]MDZ8103222.1 hypothetical protein [Nostoc sp. DedSLP01]MDZ8188027.1 hypothetical protein [Nostoc sp. ChiSLP02]